ncbi:hypothetical protein A2U01_0099183, partial [Trifolium medium]|nr:hypothetical protein [Trifolium medium]
MDHDRALVLEVLARFTFHRYVEGRNVYAALDAVIDEDEDNLVEPMIARPATIGDIPGVQEGDVFIYRAEI